ncbi:hypothetical protein Poli38472_013086 [Pythium oligandrum]|uniref:Uncharacterized protein n=1 Tax=Pythium oligandrum TaxID=41045 RepID=A0A8K1C2E2_PYTOL|nr:hypothetical protein Poli38472_013086 [Pythium oligandrum]|eukprot:TMW55195.1 hypothetical protein Poli38472_013086 [Pythium oligandrum]
MIGCLVWFFLEPSHKCGKRFLILMLMSSSNGIIISAIVAIALRVDPFIIVTSFLMTTVVFMSFSGWAILAARRSYLYLGALLSSALSTLIFIDAVNVFTWSAEFFDVQLLCGLVLFCLYVIFDTQMIIERAP